MYSLYSLISDKCINIFSTELITRVYMYKPSRRANMLRHRTFISRLGANNQFYNIWTFSARVSYRKPDRAAGLHFSRISATCKEKRNYLSFVSDSINKFTSSETRTKRWWYVYVCMICRWYVLIHYFSSEQTLSIRCVLYHRKISSLLINKLKKCTNSEIIFLVIYLHHSANLGQIR